MSTYEAALNRLKEERMSVGDARAAIARDNDLKAEDIDHWRQLMSQTWRELTQLGAAIDALTMLSDGRAVLASSAVEPCSCGDVPDIPAQGSARRDQGLIRKTAPIGAWQA